MKKKTLFVNLLTALAVAALSPSLSVAAEKDVWNGYLSGQAGSPLKTDFVMAGNIPTASDKSKDKYNWNGHLSGQASSPMKSDFSVLPAAGSNGWNGYLNGSLSVWEQWL